MGYQFAHLESFSRKADSKGRSTDFIFAEVTREPEASIHVFNPLPPVVVFGVGIKDLQEMHDAAASAAVIQVEGGKTRKIRKDQKTLHTVVASHPYSMNEIRADPAKRAEAEEWEKRTVDWLRSQYGDDLKSVVRHEDERYFHVHAYVLPDGDPSLKAIQYHPGVITKRGIIAAGPADGEDAKTLEKRGNVAYKTAMRQWQDSYYAAVSIPCGLTRLGPQNRRLSRGDGSVNRCRLKRCDRRSSGQRRSRSPATNSFPKRKPRRRRSVLPSTRNARQQPGRPRLR